MHHFQPFPYHLEDDIAVPEMMPSQRYPQFLEGRYNMKSKFEKTFNSKGTQFSNFSSPEKDHVSRLGDESVSIVQINLKTSNDLEM